MGAASISLKPLQIVLIEPTGLKNTARVVLMARSAVKICNQALGWIGGNRINSLDQRSTESILCNDNYDELRQVVLEDVAWNFAKARMVLDAKLVPDADFWGDVSIYPIKNAGDVITVDRVFDEQGSEFQTEGWTVEGDNILVPGSNGGRIYVQYTRDVKDPEKFSAGFAQALAARLAADLAIPIAESRQLQADMWNLYNAKIKAAAANEGSQGSNERIRPGNMTRRRYSNEGAGYLTRRR